MKILYDNTLSTKQLPKRHTLLLDSRVLPSKLNIKLKTHSLTCLDIPLETFAGVKEISSLRKDHQKTIAGSVDLISEIQQSTNDENLSRFSSSKPLISIASTNQQFPKVQQEWRQILKHRFRISSSFITPTSFNDSVARLRRSRHLQNIHQSSLQTIDKITERKRRLSFTQNGSIPKFTFRDLPSNPRPSIPTNQFEQSYQSRMSPFTSLPEIRSFVEQNCSDHLKSFNHQLKLPTLAPSSSWKKSGSWSWKSSNDFQFNATETERIKSNIVNKETQRQIDDHFYSNLPVIIESPLQQRSSLQKINQNYHPPSLSCRHDHMQQKPHRLYQKKKPFPHSISNYEVSPNRFSFQPTTRYPSTPLLSHSRPKNIDKFDCHPFQFNASSIATFDDDDSISSTSSFRSCLNSINDFSENNMSESSSSSLLSDSCFQEISPNYDLHTGIGNETIKPTRLSSRHLCILQ